MDSPSTSTEAPNALRTISKTDVTTTLGMVNKNIGPQPITDKNRLWICIMKLWSTLKKFEMIINGRTETSSYALDWYNDKDDSKECGIYYNMLGHPMYKTSISIADFLICGFFNSPNSIVNHYYSDVKTFSKLEGFTCSSKLICEEEEECITYIDNPSCIIYHKEMKVDGLENMHASKSIDCKFGDIQPSLVMTTRINVNKMPIVINNLRDRKNAMLTGNFMKTSVTNKSLSFNGKSFITIDRAILDMIKCIYLHCPTECEAYRLNKDMNIPIDETDYLIKYWRIQARKKSQDIMHNCQELLMTRSSPLPICDFILALLTDILCAMSVGTFI